MDLAWHTGNHTIGLGPTIELGPHREKTCTLRILIIAFVTRFLESSIC